MKEYTAPQMTVVDNWEELKIEPATLEWALDEERNQIVVTSRYEKVEPEDDDDEYRYFKLRGETVEVLRVDCDPAVIEIVKEGVDEEGNRFKTIVTKSQQVAFQIGVYNGEVKDAMDFESEEFSVHYTELYEYTVAFHKDGRWWFLELNHDNLGLMGFTYWDDEADDDVEVPFSCEALSELTEYEPYVRGEQYGDFENGLYGKDLWLVCEDGEDQYGVNFYEGRGAVELLTRIYYSGAADEPWTAIKLVGNMTIRSVEDEEGLKKQWICYKFGASLMSYNRDDEDSKKLEWSLVNGKSLRVVQGDMVQFFQTKRDFFVRPDKEENELFRDIRAGLYGYMGMECKAQIGDYFIVKQEVPVGSLKKVQYRIIFEDNYIGGVWDDAETLGLVFKGYVPLFRVKKDGCWGVINEVGTVVVPLKYQKISVDSAAIHKEKQVRIDGTEKNILCNLILDEFGQKGFGVLVDTDKQSYGAQRMDQFFQILPCNFEAVMPAFTFSRYEGIQVEKMGRVALYNYFGKLEENFKPGHTDSTVF